MNNNKQRTIKRKYYAIMDANDRIIGTELYKYKSWAYDVAMNWNCSQELKRDDKRRQRVVEAFVEINIPEDDFRKPCKHEDLCPWGVKPCVGMWKRIGDIEFWGTDCVAYLICPRKNWTDEQWKSNIKNKPK